MKYNGKKLNFLINKNKHEIKSNVGVDWLLDYGFNNGSPLICTRPDESQYGHYDNLWWWKKEINQTLCVEGNLKRRANKNMPWTYFE